MTPGQGPGTPAMTLREALEAEGKGLGGFGTILAEITYHNGQAVGLQVLERHRRTKYRLVTEPAQKGAVDGGPPGG